MASKLQLCSVTVTAFSTAGCSPVPVPRRQNRLFVGNRDLVLICSCVFPLRPLHARSTSPGNKKRGASMTARQSLMSHRCCFCLSSALRSMSTRKTSSPNRGFSLGHSRIIQSLTRIKWREYYAENLLQCERARDGRVRDFVRQALTLCGTTTWSGEKQQSGERYLPPI